MVKDIKNELFQLGIKAGMAFEVHCSSDSFGYVVGGAKTLIKLLFESEKDSEK